MDKNRPCKVGKRSGEFHAWESVSQIVPPSPMIGGHGGGVISQTFALVEFEDGHIERCEPYNVVFADKEPPRAEETPKQQQERGFIEIKTECPFCERENSNAIIFADEVHKEYFVYCPKCGIETIDTYTTKAKAVKAFTDGKNKNIKGANDNDRN